MLPDLGQEGLFICSLDALKVGQGYVLEIGLKKRCTRSVLNPPETV